MIRNAGGRVTAAAIADIAFLAFLAGQLPGGGQTAGTSSLRSRLSITRSAAPDFSPTLLSCARPPRRPAWRRLRWRPRAVANPYATVKADVEHLLASPLLSPKVSVSGHVYDVGTGRVSTVADARYP